MLRPTTMIALLRHCRLGDLAEFTSPPTLPAGVRRAQLNGPASGAALLLGATLLLGGAQAARAAGGTLTFLFADKEQATTDVNDDGIISDNERISTITKDEESSGFTDTTNDKTLNNNTDLAYATVMLAGPPAAPTGLTAHDRGTDEVLLEWTDPGNSNITGYQYQQKKEDDSYGDWVDISGSDATTTSHTIKGLEEATEYTFRIRVMIGEAAGEASLEATKTTALASLTGFTVTPGSDADEVTLSWDDPGNSNITGYKYQYKKGNGFYGAWVVIADSSATTTSHSVGGLDAGTRYTFAIRPLVDNDNVYTYLSYSSATTKPGKPTGFSASAGDGQVTLNWDDPGSSNITEYGYRLKTGTGTYSDWTTIANGTTTFSHIVEEDENGDTLENGTEYTFQIRAEIDGLYGIESDEVTATPVGQGVLLPPDAPIWLWASHMGTDGVVLHWDDPGNSNITGYQYQQKKEDGPYGGWVDVYRSSATTTNATITRLEEATEYSFRIRAMIGEVPGEASWEVTTGTALESPNGFTATPGSDADEVMLSWDPGNSKITGYEYQYRKENGFYVDWVTISGSDATTTSHTIDGLDSGTRYIFKVRALMDNDNVPIYSSLERRATTKPGKPTAFNAIAGDGQVTLGWDDPGNSNITGYEYRVKTRSDSYSDWTTIANGTTTFSHIVEEDENGDTLENGTEYTFQIRAEIDGLYGIESDEVTATPVGQGVLLPPDALIWLWASHMGAEGVVLHWDDPENSNITGYQYQQKKEDGPYGDWIDVYRSSATTTNATITGLEEATEYSFRIRAMIGEVPGEASWEVTTGTALESPNGFTATPGSDADEVMLSWDPGNSKITGYEYQYRKEDGFYVDWVTISGSDATTTSHTIDGLDSGTRYIFKVRALMDNDNVPIYSSLERRATTKPGKPTAFNAIAGDGQVTLSWDDPGNSNITEYGYRVKTGSDSYSDWTTIANGTTTFSHIVEEDENGDTLENGTEYTFQIRAEIDGLYGIESDEVKATPVEQNTSTKPAAPTGLTAYDRGTDEVLLEWTDPGNSNITGYQYQQKKEDGSYGDWVDISGSGATTTSHTIQGLEEATEYTFRIRVMIGEAAGEASLEATKTTALASLTGFTVTPGSGADEVTLSWDDPGNSNITGYKYQYKKGNGFYGAWVVIADSSATTTSHSVGGLDAGTRYTFAIRPLVDNDNVYTYLSYSSATTKPGKPTGFSATAGDGQVTLGWDDPGNSNITEYGYRVKTGSDSYSDWTTITNGTITFSHIVEEDKNGDGLENGTEYTFQIRAEIDGLYGIESDEVKATPVEQSILPPAAPSWVWADESGTGEIELLWTGLYNSNVTAYQYQYKKEDGLYGDWVDIPGSSNAIHGHHDIRDLEEATEYTFRIRAMIGDVPGEASLEATATTPPGSPTGFTATPGSDADEVVLSWDDPGKSNITGYEYKYRKEDGSYSGSVVIAGSDATTTSHTVDGLDAGTRYTFRVRGMIGKSRGQRSRESTVITRPGKPTGFSATAGDGQVTLGWDDPGNSNITEYGYRVKTGSDSYSDWTTITNGTITFSHIVEEDKNGDGLENGTEYTFQIRAEIDGLYGIESDEVKATPVEQSILPPAAPSWVWADESGTGEIELLWTGLYNSNVTAYQYQYKKEDGLYGDWVDIPGSSNAIHGHHDIRDLEEATEYTFRIRAMIGDVPGEASLEATATTPPGSPTGFTATPGSDADEVVLSWDDPGKSNITGYEYKYRKEDGSYSGSVVIAGSDATTTSHTVDGLDAGTRYTFRVRGMIGKSRGQRSRESTVITRPGKPTGFSATAGDGQVTLGWDDPGNSNITEYGYRVKTGSDSYSDWTTITNGTITFSHIVEEDENGDTLENGTEYTFQIRAEIDGLYGIESDEVKATPVEQSILPPAAPSWVSADESGTDEIELLWTGLYNSNVTAYQYQYKKEDGLYGDWVDIPGSSNAIHGHHDIRDLEEGTEYTFRIRAMIGDVPGEASLEATATTPPGSPTGFTATPGSDADEVVLSWDDPGKSNITGYEYKYRKEDGSYGDWVDISGSDATTTSHTIDGLDAGTRYTFRVRGMIGKSRGQRSRESTVITRPGKPTGFSATAGDGQVTLGWDDPGNSNITEYGYRVKTGSDSYSDWTTITNGTITFSHIVEEDKNGDGLENGTEYTFQIRAEIDGLYGIESDEVKATPVEQSILPPAAPSWVWADESGTGEIELLWTGLYNSNVTAYQYQYKKEDGLYGDWVDIPGSSNAIHGHHDIRDLEEATEYTFRIRAMIGDVPGEASLEATATTPPGSPTGFTATPGSDADEVVLSWDDPGKSNITGYEYKYRKEDGSYSGSVVIAGSDATTTSHTVDGLDAGTRYTFRVRGMIGKSRGAKSRESTVITRPGKPTGFSATAGDGQVTLGWDDPGNSNITEYGYRVKTGSDSYSDWTTITNGTTTFSHIVEEDKNGDGLENGTEYTFQIRAEIDGLYGIESDEVKATPVEQSILPPAAPSWVSADESGTDEIELLWTGLYNSNVTVYQYQYKKEDGLYGDWVDIPGSSNAIHGHHDIRDLEEGTEYTFRVRAMIGDVPGEASLEATATTPPGSPTGFTATPGSDADEVVLSWDDPGKSNITGYEYKYRKEDGSYGDWVDISGSDATTTSHTVDGLDAGTRYTFRVRRMIGKSRGQRSRESTVITRPGKPTGFSATAGDGQVTLGWDDPGNSNITEYGYRVKTGSDSYSDWTAIANGTTTFSHIVEEDENGDTLENGAEYTFQIRAEIDGLYGIQSDEVTATPVGQGASVAPRLSLALDTNSISENGGVATVTATLDHPSEHDTTVSITATPVAPAVAGDFTLSSPTSLTIAAGETTSTGTVTISAVNNESHGQAKAVTITATASNNVSVTSSLTLTIADDEAPTVTLTLDTTAISEDGGVATITATLDKVSDAATTVSITATPVAPAVKEDFTLSSTTELTIAAGATTSTGTVTITAVDNDVAAADKTVTISATADNELGGLANPVDVALTITENDAVAMEEGRETATKVITEVARSTLSGATTVIGQRFDAALGGPAMLSVADWQVGDILAADTSLWEQLERWDGDLTMVNRLADGVDLLAQSNFSLPLSSSGGGTWSLWGRGDWRGFEGTTDLGSYEGSQKAGYLGVDKWLNERLMAGLAVSHGTSETNYTIEGEGRRIDTSLTSIWPYLQNTMDNGAQLRLVLGFGQGEVEHHPTGEANEKTDLTMRAVSVAGKLPVAQPGDFTLSATAAASLADMKTEGLASVAAINGLHVSSWNLRAGLEAKHEGFPVSDTQWTLTPRVALALRQDGGDGVTGTGAELSGGLRLAAPDSRFTLDGSAYWLALHSQDGTKEWGASVEARFSPGEGGEGLSLSVEPTWGVPYQAGVLASEDLFEEERRVNNLGRLSLTAHAGYGFELPSGLLTPFVELTLPGEAEATRYAAGLNFAAPGGLDAKLSGERQDDDTRVGIDLSVQF